MQSLIEFLRQAPDTANAVAAIASAITSVLALFVSLVAVYVARATLRHQREHDVLSVKPLPTITLGDYENQLVVLLENHGTGPLIVTAVSATRGSEHSTSVIDLMPFLPPRFAWTTFVAAIDKRAILPGNYLTLLELNGDKGDPGFVATRDTIRRALAPILLTVEYTDMYGSETQTVARDFAWFCRNLDPVPTPTVVGHRRSR